jgi:hypothetical protein
MFGDPSVIDLGLDSRSVTFENPTGARGAGGAAARGRKGAPSRSIRAGERVTLVELEGPGTVRHVWCTVPPAPPEVMRAMVLEVFYDDETEPGVSVPLLDFFGAPCGRPRAYGSALTAVQEGRGFNAHFPMPFRRSIRIEVVNGAPRAMTLYFQVDLTLGEVADGVGVLHVGFRRENPTTLGRDFAILDTVRGPGRFLGCVVGIRVLDAGTWYGEGEVKVYRDGDRDRPTICGTGLEDYVGTAWGMGPHATLYGGAPLDVRATGAGGLMAMPEYVGFYRWHVPDPIVFADSARVTIQQIGMHLFPAGAEAARDAYVATNPLAGDGWFDPPPGVCGIGLFERRDDYSAAAFVYLRDPQPVPRVDVAAATADLERRDHETVDPLEAFLR